MKSHTLAALLSECMSLTENEIFEYCETLLRNAFRQKEEKDKTLDPDHWCRHAMH